MVTFFQTKNNRIITALFAAVGLIVIITFITHLCNASGEPQVLTFQQDELEGGFYVDTSFDEGERSISTPTFECGKGYCNVTIEYETNIPAEAFFGVTASLSGKKDGIRTVNDRERTLLTSDKDSVTLKGYVPYDGQQCSVVIDFPDDESIEEYLEETRYLIVRSVRVESNGKREK
jgi:hypothetical protein